MGNKPIVLTDNFWDDVVVHNDHLVSHTGTAVEGSEVSNLADNLRDLTRFTVAETNTAINITVDCLTAKPVDGVILDRGHNLKGKTVEIRGSTDNFAASDVLIASCVVPAAVGGLSGDANGCLTAEEVWWKTFTEASYRYHRFRIAAMGASLSPIITGLYLGKMHRFPEYLDSPGAYDYRTKHMVLKNAMSERGVRVKRRLINFGEIDIRIHSMEEADFLLFQPHVNRLLRTNHPWWFCLDDSVYSGGTELMRLFQLGGDVTYDPVADPVHRRLELLFEEVIPLNTL